MADSLESNPRRAVAVRLLAGAVMASALAAPTHADPAAFGGWQAMRVVLQDGSPSRLRVSDLDGDGRDTLLVVNTRLARLEAYRWRPPEQREAPPASDPDRPNELPMAPEFERQEVPLDQLPQDAIAADLDGDGRAELLVLVSSPNRLLRLARDGADDRWQKQEQWDLPSGSYGESSRLLRLWRPTAGAGPRAMIDFADGIATLELEPGAQPAWLEPRDRTAQRGWWLSDTDGDADADLIVWSGESGRTVQWWEAADGRLLPPQVLHDRPADGVLVRATASGADELWLLGGVQSGMLRRYRMSVGERSELGRREALVLPAGEGAAWCGMRLGERRVLVTADKDQPRLLVYELTETGWRVGEDYPVLAETQRLVAPAAEPGLLLIGLKDAGELYASRWDGERFTFPRVWAPDGAGADAAGAGGGDGEEVADVKTADDDGDRRIVGLGEAGPTAWWAQRVGADLRLYTWSAGEAQPTRIDFKDAGEKIERAEWLGDHRLLVHEQYARNPKLLTRGEDGAARLDESAHVRKLKLEQVRLIETEGSLRVARIADGVLQWLDATMQPSDQVMLTEGRRLVSYVPIEGGAAWALEQGGAFAHRLEPDEAGIPRVTRSVKLPGGSALQRDRVLGLMLVQHHGVIRLSEGRSPQLELIQSMDGRLGRPEAPRDATIHRALAADVTGDGADELLLADDKRHELTLLDEDGEELVPRLSWVVFEDRAYPYGYSSETTVSEPRVVVGCDLDGDDHRDLAMLCHDRLLIYLGREETP